MPQELTYGIMGGHGEIRQRISALWIIIMRIKNAASWIGLLIFLMAVGSILWLHGTGAIDRRNCRQQLRSLGAAILQYRSDHEGQIPTGFRAINFVSVQVLEKCPGAVSGDKTGGKEDPDYVFVNWHEWFTITNAPPDDYPLVYDRKLSNHHGLGVNVLSVCGEVVWDKRAQQLKNFSLQHPEYHLPIPQ